MSLAAKLALTPILVAQALRTRARMPRLPEPAGEREGRIGRGPLLRLLIAGDSSAAGVGVVDQGDALAGQLTQALVRQGGVSVEWRLLARSGLNTEQTHRLLEAEASGPADIAVIVTGVNDVVEQVASHRAVAAREALANWLRNARGVRHVVFAPLPPVHRFPGLPQPLRWVAGRDARRHNAALVRWASTRPDVSVAAVALPLEPSAMASDGFHPGALAYRVCGEAIAQHIAAELRPSMRLQDLWRRPGVAAPHP